MTSDSCSVEVGGPSPGRTMDEESARWVVELSGDEPLREAAVSRLHRLLLRGAVTEASRRAGQHGIGGPELEDLAHQAAGDAVVSILSKLDDFRGESRFTTWAYAFVIHEISDKFGRHVWRRDGVRLDDEDWDRLPEAFGGTPADLAESRELVAAVREGVATALTEHQRRVFAAIVLNGAPLDAVVVELGSNRNAVYKTVFDARRKLRTHLVARGFLDQDGARP